MSDERQVVLQAALDEFAEAGIHTGSLDAVAKRAAMEVRAVRALFIDEKALLLELLREITDPIVSAISVAVEDTDEPRELIGKSLDMLDDWMADNPKYVRLVIQCMASDPSVLMILYRCSLFPSEFIERFEQFAAGGRIREKDLSMVMVMIDSLMFFPHLTTSFLTPDGEDTSAEDFLARRRKAVMGLFEHGLLA